MEMEETRGGQAEIEEYPDGGRTAWIIVLGSWLALMTPMGWLNTLAVLQARVSQDELSHMPESTIGWIFSSYAFFLYCCGAQVGPIFDAYDVRFLVIPGSIGIVASAMLLSVCKEFYQFLLSFGVLGGISASLLFNPAVAIIGHWFCKRRALATGIACTAGGIGGIIFPLVILYLAPRIGFSWSLRIIGFISAVSNGAACCLLRKRLPHNKSAGAFIDFKALLDLKYGLTTLSVFLVEFAVFIPYTYISSYALAVGYSTHDAFLLNVLLNVGAIPGRALPGFVADRFGAFNTLSVTSLVCGLLIFALWYTSGASHAAVYSFTVLYGFWSGATISLTPVCISRVCKIEDYGKRNGTSFFIASLGVLIGIPIAGAILRLDNGSYSGVILFSGAFYLAGTVLLCITRGLAVGWSFRLLF